MKIRFSQLGRRKMIAILAGILAVVLLGAVVVVAMGDDDAETPEAASTTTSSSTSTTTTTTAPPIAPLTGLLGDPALLGRPAIIVKVDNTGRALGVQEGIDRADVVVVEQVEGAVTRLAAVFHSQNAEPGPIRSARTSDIAISRNFGLPLFTNSGGNGGVLSEVRRSDAVVDTGIDSPGAGAVFNRYRRGTGLLRFFVPIEELYAIREGEGSPPEPLWNYRPAGLAPGGEPVSGLEITYGRRGTNVRYEWDGQGWLRSQDGRPHVMAKGGPRIAPANVIAMTVPYRDSGYFDTGGNPSPEAILDGGGDALVFTGGELIWATWRGMDQGGRLSFVDPLGLPIALAPGQTFLELTDGGASPF